MSDLLKQCVSEAVILWSVMKTEAETAIDLIIKESVVKKHGLQLETVVVEHCYCPYCYFDEVVGNSNCKSCPGLIENGEGFPLEPSTILNCFDDRSPYKKFDSCSFEEQVEAVSEMYELTKRVAKYYNVEV